VALGAGLVPEARDEVSTFLCRAAQGPWADEEEVALVHMHQELGNAWTFMSSVLGRPANSIKNHWNATVRNKRPGQSLLSAYIQVSSVACWDLIYCWLE
jgi:hypothetical protein